MNKIEKIAVIPGDGIGKEIMPEALRCLEKVAKKFAINFEFLHFDWASCDYYLKTGQMLPDNWKSQLSDCQAILFGAVGMPQLVPDNISLWGSLLKFRREFEQYINYRPVRLFEGINCPLANKKPGDIDMIIIRENTEGEYTNLGGKIFADTNREVVIQESVFTRIGANRVLNYAFNLSNSRPRKKITVATKSNGIAISMPWWDERADEVAKNFPQIKVDKQHIDILAARMVLKPEQFDVVVATNLFGDILSDLAPACAGTIGIAPSANINPERDNPSLFEPVHGSAPDIYGKNIANPTAMIWSAALMLEFLGYQSASDCIVAAMEKVLANRSSTNSHTPDLGGNASTTEMGKAIAELI